MDIRKQFAKNLTHLMKVSGKRQQDLIEELGYSSSTLSQWCTGKNIPRPSRIEILARYFGVSVDSLYAGEDPAVYAEVNELTARLEKISIERDNYKEFVSCLECKLEEANRSSSNYRLMIETLKADGAKEISIKF